MIEARFVDIPYQFQVGMTSRITCEVNALPPALLAELVEVVDGEEIVRASLDSTVIGALKFFSLHYDFEPTLDMNDHVFRCHANNIVGVMTVEISIIIFGRFGNEKYQNFKILLCIHKYK